jgi:succinate-acetate transporter protein
MTNNETAVAIKDTTGNPAPLGLLGFGMTTILLNLHNAGFYGVNSMIIGMGIFMGGIAQIIAGVQEWKKDNTFGATAFTAYGSFWLSLVALWLIPKMSFGAAYASDEESIGWYLLMWGIFTLFMFIGTLRANRMLQVVFASLTLLFFLLAISDFYRQQRPAHRCRLRRHFLRWQCFYGCVALILNDIYGRAVLPLGSRK